MPHPARSAPCTVGSAVPGGSRVASRLARGEATLEFCAVWITPPSLTGGLAVPRHKLYCERRGIG